MAAISQNTTDTNTEGNIKTGFLTLACELRQSILLQSVNLNALEGATQHVTDRFLTWEDLFDGHEQHIQDWTLTLKLVHREMAVDVDYVAEKWEKGYQALVEERIMSYEESARKRRAQFLEENPRNYK